MPSITLKYVNSSGTFSRAFSALSVKGFKPGDGHVAFPQLYSEYLNGSIRKKQSGFRRVIDIDLGVVTDATDLTALGEFLGSEEQYLTYTYGSTTETDLRVVDRHEEWESEWVNKVELGRRCVLRVEEAALRTTYPSGSTPTPPTETMYFKKRVEITGTLASPQTLTFGSGALVATESGGTFPTVNAGTQVYTVSISDGYQEAGVFMASTPSINGSNYVTFTVAHSEAGNAASDGKYYADIRLTVQQI